VRYCIWRQRICESINMPRQNTVIYCDCMAEVRQRMEAIRDILPEITSDHGDDVFMSELVFLQLRKVLELIAFASLTANSELYVQVRKDFENEWNIKKVIERLERINDRFYPVPIQKPVTLGNGMKEVRSIDTGYMTKRQLVFLYNACSNVIHIRNPFQKRNPITHFGYHITTWLERIETLTALHLVNLADDGLWIVEVPDEGVVKCWETAPIPLISPGPAPEATP
jgi:hypothetical protein